jgi:hypothetical protein
MIDPNFTQGKSREEIIQLTDKVRSEYYKNKGIPEPKREQIFVI